jgi:hypothetical protein
MSPNTLLALPEELLWDIFAYVFETGSSLHDRPTLSPFDLGGWMSDPNHPIVIRWGMLLISRRLYPIVVRIMYSRPEFQFGKATRFHNFLTNLRPGTLELIRYVTVDVNSSEFDLRNSEDTPPMDEHTEKLEITKWVDCLALLPTELRRIELCFNGGEEPGLAFFTKRGTHPLLLHALRRFSELEELSIASPPSCCKLHFDFLFHATPYFNRYNPTFLTDFLADSQSAPIFPKLRDLQIWALIAQDPAYLTAALSAQNLHSLQRLTMKPRLQNHSEVSDAFPPEIFKRLRPLSLFVWRLFDDDHAEVSPPLPHRDLAIAHLAALSKWHKGTLQELWLDLTRTTLQSRDVWAFLNTLTHVRRLVLWIPPQCFSLLTLLATDSDDGFLPSLRDLEIAVTCHELSTTDREAIIPLPLSPFSMKLQWLRVIFFIGVVEQQEAVEARIRSWLVGTRVSDSLVRGIEKPTPWCEFIVESGGDDQMQRDFGFEAGDGSYYWRPLRENPNDPYM